MERIYSTMSAKDAVDKLVKQLEKDVVRQLYVYLSKLDITVDESDPRIRYITLHIPDEVLQFLGDKLSPAVQSMVGVLYPEVGGQI